MNLRHYQAIGTAEKKSGDNTIESFHSENRLRVNSTDDAVPIRGALVSLGVMRAIKTIEERQLYLSQYTSDAM